MTLAELASLVCEKVGVSDSESLALAKRFLKRRYEMVVDYGLWRETTVMVTKAATSDIIVLPSVIDRITSVRYDTHRLFPSQNQTLFYIDPNIYDRTGTPITYSIMTPLATQAALSTAQQLRFSSNNTLDTEKRIRIQGELSNVTKTETRMLSGTVAVNSLNSYDSVFVLTKEATAGTVTVSGATDGTVYQTLGPTDTGYAHLRFQLLGKPADTSKNVLVFGKRKLPQLTDDLDVPILRGSDNILIAYAVGDMLEKQKQYNKAQLKIQEATALLQELAGLEKDQQTDNPRVIPDDDWGVGESDTGASSDWFDDRMFISVPSAPTINYGTVAVEESDGNPTIPLCSKIKVAPGDLTDETGGVARIRTASDVGTTTPGPNVVPKTTGSGVLDNWITDAQVGIAGKVIFVSDGQSIALRAPQSNDSRLSNSRAPTGPATGDLADNYPNPRVAKLQGRTLDGSAPTDNQVIKWNATANQWQPGLETATASPVTIREVDGTPSVSGVSVIKIGNNDLTDEGGGTIRIQSASDVPDGTTLLKGKVQFDVDSGGVALRACQGNDTRLSNARTPTAHATSHKHGGSDEVATATATANAIPKADASALLDTWISDGSTTVKGKVELATDGEAIANVVVQGNDSRMSNARTPTGTASGDLSGTYPSPVVAKIQGDAVSTTNPSDGQVLKWVAASSEYQPSFFKIAQVVTAYDSTYTSTTSTIPVDNTIPQITEGASFPGTLGSGLSITPKNASSTLIIYINTRMITHGTGNAMTVALFKDSGADALAATALYPNSVSAGDGCSILHTISAGSTSAQLFKLRFGPPAGTAYLHGNGTAGLFNGTAGTTMVILEVLP